MMSDILKTNNVEFIGYKYLYSTIIALICSPGLIGYSVTIGEILLILFVNVWLFNRCNLSLVFTLLAVLAIYVASTLYNSHNLDLAAFYRFTIFIFLSIAIALFLLHGKGLRSEYIYTGLFIGAIANFTFQLLQVAYPDIFFMNIPPENRSAVLGGLLFRNPGLLLNPNTLALFYLTIMPIALHLNKRFVLIICVLGAMLTFSKTIALVPFIFLAMKISVLFTPRYIFTLLIIFCFIFVTYMQGAFDFFIDAMLYRTVEANSFDSRFVGLSEKLAFMFDEPSRIFFGLGVGEDFLTQDLKVHNKFFSVFLQFGLFSLLLFILYFLILIFYSIHKNSMVALVTVLVYAAIINFHTLVYFNVELVIMLLPIFILRDIDTQRDIIKL